MNTQSLGAFGGKRELKIPNFGRFFHRGQPGERIVFGYMFRVIAAIISVLTTSMIIFTWSTLFTSGILTQGMAISFAIIALGQFAIAEGLRIAVYERSRSSKTGHGTSLRSLALSPSKFRAKYHRTLRDDMIVRILEQFADRSQPEKFVNKRIFDAAVSASGLLFLSPLIIMTCALIRFESRGPILHRIPILCRDNKIIYATQFRTHRVIETGPPIGDDKEYSRLPLPMGEMTRVGNFLHRTSLDLLPQLLDVIAGRMSIVGPTPRYYRILHSTENLLHEDVTILKPALIDLINPRDLESDNIKLLHKIYESYARHYSATIDLQVILRNLRAIIYEI